MEETVNHPKHYNVGKFETIDVIEDWRLNFNLGNAVKYISRCEHKGSKVDDIKKAIWYLQRELDKYPARAKVWEKVRKEIMASDDNS